MVILNGVPSLVQMPFSNTQPRRCMISAVLAGSCVPTG